MKIDAAYEQVARRLRQSIIAGEFDVLGRIKPGGGLASEFAVSLATAQQAVRLLTREGLVAPVSRQLTIVLPRRPWLVEFGTPLSGTDDEMTAAAKSAGEALRRAGEDQAAVRETKAQRIGDGLRLRLVVESADAGGATATALDVAREALGDLPIWQVAAAQHEAGH